MITYIEPDILKSKVKWALGSMTKNKASGGNRIPVELNQVLKDDAVKVLQSIYQEIWKTQQWLQDWKKVSFPSTPKERQCQIMFKHHTIAVISHASEVMLEILHVRLKQYMN